MATVSAVPAHDPKGPAWHARRRIGLGSTPPPPALQVASRSRTAASSPTFAYSPYLSSPACLPASARVLLPPRPRAKDRFEYLAFSLTTFVTLPLSLTAVSLYPHSTFPVHPDSSALVIRVKKKIWLRTPNRNDQNK